MGTRRLIRDRVEIGRFRLRVVSGPDAPLAFDSTSSTVTVGTARGEDVFLTDRCVSRHHCVIRVEDDGLLCEDLGSTNGTLVAGRRVSSAVLAPGDSITVGETVIVVDALDGTISEPLSHNEQFGPVLGRSAAMRYLFALAERVAPSDATILIEGETGTGKTMLAEAIHAASPRAAMPFVVVDCASLPRSLLESELFGHERGAFTGAIDTRVGLFESANGGTILLDEIGELPLDLQPKLLRAIERRVVRRIGASSSQSVNIRIIAATNRDLRRAVNANTFRSDLFYRLNTVRVVVPPLRERREDIPMLVASIYRELLGDPRATPPADVVRPMMRADWPGNVRELRSAVERSLLGAPQANAAVADADQSRDIEEGLSFRTAKTRASSEWERRYLSELLFANGGNISAAARAGKMNRSHLSELLQRHGLNSIANDVSFAHDDKD
jgi:transcriptional regulator with GAF, ATPase, and Fis domain